ncbi:LytTR family DNA-binding domain-containing protein [Streptococcus massiliensis]|uniref:LytTR family DNA-binding domain-containing protein n=1 Tax=Streptococcus massiliensis TaxID=313439 RepID=UPI0003478C40|nr:LytTR family DNA-binding domain-containing protein [Streptococcus massiliensis]
MKIRIELDETITEAELVIRAPQLTDQIQQIQALLKEFDRKPLIFYKGTSEYFLDVTKILFFETDGDKVFAHTGDNAYEVKLKLYELEDYLPRIFCRISKSTIVNAKKIYSLDKSFSGTSSISFYETHKQTHVSRHYYQFLKERLQEMR